MNGRLIRDGPCAPEWNMSADEALLHTAIARLSEPIVRIYGWSQAAVSIGRFQNADRDIRLDYCRQHNIAIVRRPTGGRGVLHGSDITVSIVIRQESLGHAGRSVLDSYRALSAGIIHGIGSLGLAAVQGECEGSTCRTGDCFSRSSGADITVEGGAKLVGGAQRRKDGVILQQCSIRWRRPAHDPSSVFHGPVRDGIYPLEKFAEDTIREAVIAGMGEALGIWLRQDSLQDGFLRVAACGACS